MQTTAANNTKCIINRQGEGKHTQSTLTIRVAGEGEVLKLIPHQDLESILKQQKVLEPICSGTSAPHSQQ
jgi:hypothetical protein